MTKTEKLLRAAAELKAMPENLDRVQQHAWLMSTEHFKRLTIDESEIAMKLARIAEVIADE